MIDSKEVKEFLLRLWGLYTSLDAKCYEIMGISDRIMVKQFCIGEDGEIEEIINKAIHYCEGLKGHIYFGVLPRKNKAEKGRGKTKDVSVGLWLWIDLDYKREDKEGECIEEKIEEKDNYALKGCYREGYGNMEKWIIVERPPKEKVIESLKELGLEPTILVDSGSGYQAYFKLEREVEASKITNLERLLLAFLEKRGFPVDTKASDLARVMRLVGTINPRTQRISKVIHWKNIQYNPETLIEMLKEESRKETQIKTSRTTLKALGDNILLEIKELVKDAYVSGKRQDICLYLSGWFAKAKIDPLELARLIRMLHEEKQDEDPLEERLSTIPYSYAKIGLWNEEIKQRFSSLIEEWGLEKRKVYIEQSEHEDKNIRGKTGLQEILEQTIGEEKALDIIRRIEEILGVASPFYDSIFELLDYEKQIYAVANPRRMVIARVKRTEDKITYKERIAPICPTKIIVYLNPLGGVRKYEIVFEGQTLQKPLVIGPAAIEDIADRLRAEGLVYHKRLLDDVLNAVIQGFIRKGKAEIKEEIEAPGFYLVNGKILAVKIDVKKPDKEELKEALNLLNELGEKWFNHIIDRFSTTIKWWLIAPFNYIYKQKGKWFEWLYHYGPPDTGKSTLNKIGLSFWGLSTVEKPGSTIDTPARIGHILSSSTLPTPVKEPGGLLTHDSVLEMIKSAIEDVIARGKYVRGVYVEIPALSPLSFTSNKYLPRDEALIKRLLILKYSWGERRNTKQIKEFDTQVKPKLEKLKSIGDWTAWKIINNPDMIKMDWKELSTKLLKEMYNEIGEKPPRWIEIWYEKQDYFTEDSREIIREFLIKRINEEYTRFVGRVTVGIPDTTRQDSLPTLERDEISFRERVRIVLENKLLPWAIRKEDNVIFTTGFAKEIEKYIGEIGGLKSIGELLGWDYKKSIKINNKVLQGITTRFEDLIDFLE